MQDKENAFKKYGMTNWLLYKSYGDDFEDFVSMISVGRVFNSGSIFQPTAGRGLLLYFVYVFV